MTKVISLLFLGIGVFLLTQAIFPLLAYKVWEITYIHTAIPLVAPVEARDREVLGVAVQSDASNFPSFVSTISRLGRLSYQKFDLTIPKLKITNQSVLIDSNDLNLGLAHLPGTALPGEKGAVFISGHSSGFFSFKTDNAQRIFTDLVKLQKEDLIQLMLGSQTFNYKVIGMRIVDPQDLSVISPPDQFGRYVSLMTCVPPGINTKRLVVLGQLE